MQALSLADVKSLYSEATAVKYIRTSFFESLCPARFLCKRSRKKKFQEKLAD